MSKYYNKEKYELEKVVVTCPKCGIPYLKNLNSVNFIKNRTLNCYNCHSMRQRRLPTMPCDYCGKECKPQSSQIKNSETHFCNLKCYSKYTSMQTPMIKCDQCGDYFRRAISEMNETESVNNFCSRRCNGLSQRVKSPSKHHLNWEYIKWIKAVYEKDDYICQDCKVYGGKLVAHHIKGWANFPKLRYEINNGMTLCKNCHKKRKNKDEGEYLEGLLRF